MDDIEFEMQWIYFRHSFTLWWDTTSQSQKLRKSKRLQIFQPRSFQLQSQRKLFNPRLYNHESFNHELFDNELFNHELFNRELFNYEFLKKRVEKFTGVPSLGVTGWHPHVLADPFSTRGGDYAQQIILAPPDFQTFLQPSFI